MGHTPDPPSPSPDGAAPSPRAPGPGARGAALFALALGFEGGLLALAWGLGRLWGVSPWAGWTWTPAPLAWGAAAGLAPALAVIVALRARVGFVARLLDGLGGALDALLALRPWQLAGVALAAGAGEEALFRGVVQPAVTAALLPWIDGAAATALGVAGGALLFGLAHPVSRGYVGLAAAFGVWLGALASATGSLLAPTVAHALYDLILLLYLRPRS